jgi:hypothetical protein
VNRLGFMSIPLTGDGLYPFLEEIAGLSSHSLLESFRELGSSCSALIVAF